MAEVTKITALSTQMSNKNGMDLNKNGMDFITVVSVGTGDANQEQIDQEVSTSTEAEDQLNAGYVTVLKIGESNNQPKEIIEEVLVYRLPGERLGFGLKFEGGTKAAEFVKRLFIQSCAPDSPASMVHCSWGKLTEGDEVLNIDSLPVTSMTRIDCVRCLKDSNVVIKLLVRHFINNSIKSSDDKEDNNSESSARVMEDLPLVIGAEKKRTPPPPPPVPPRKIPRKMLKDIALITNNVAPASDSDSSTPHQNSEPTVNGNRSTRFQSPRSSGRFVHSRQSPEVSRHVYRDRRLSDGSIGPPNAEVYLDLFSQEPGCNLSESDDTGSSISTIIDRFSSFPTTTNSSFAGSLPSTPTFIQKQLNISNGLNPLDKNELDAICGDNYLFTKLVSSQNGIDESDISNSSKPEDDLNAEKQNKNSEVVNDEGSPLQPPTNFQDAPLSYGNEDVGVVEASVKTSVRGMSNYDQDNNIEEIEDENGNCLKDLNINKIVNNIDNLIYYKSSKNETKKRPPPPLPPCEKPLTIMKYTKDTVNEGVQTETVNELDLPRLVHFVPKFNKNLQVCENQIQCDEATKTIESVKLFLENEIRTSKEMLFIGETDGADVNDCILDTPEPELYNSEFYNLNWSMSPQLATIGEDDEEGCQDSLSQKSPNTCTPIVIIENADTDRKELESLPSFERSDEPDGAGNTPENDAEKLGKEKDLQSGNTVILDVSVGDFCETMDAPPSFSRQPPDGDEFPDYHEVSSTPKNSKIEDSSSKLPLPWVNTALWKTNGTSSLFRDQQSSCSVRDKIAIFSNNPNKTTTSSNLKKAYKSTDDILTLVEKERLEKDKIFSKSNNQLNKVKRSASTLCKTVDDHAFEINEKTRNFDVFVANRARSSLDLTFEASHTRFPSAEKYEDVMETPASQQRLHLRSQSLLDVSSSEQTFKKDRWNLLAEQRQKSLSRLKGLIIPERVIEVDIPAVIDLPEIKSSNVPSEIPNNPVNSSTSSTETPIVPCQRNMQIPCLTTPPWSSNNASSVPKYSPAFKRKSLQVHSGSSAKIDITNNDGPCSKANLVTVVADKPEIILPKSDQKELSPKTISQSELYEINQDPKISGNLCLGDAPKSLESITSPTRSDCSFEYVSSSPDIKPHKQESPHRTCQLDTRIGLYNLPKGKEDIGRSEDESDNDSAVSSSQSSYISRTSPPTSPSHLHSNFTSRSCSINESDSLVQLKCHSTGSQPHSQSGDNQNHRLLKPQSVEAINRKNILASAKCRSGRDLKIGSPLIKRRFEEDSVVGTVSQLTIDNTQLDYNSSQYLQICTTVQKNSNDASVKSDSDVLQSETSLKEQDCSSVNNKIDCVNSTGVHQLMRNETKHVEHEKLGTNENGFKSNSICTTTNVVNNEITFAKRTKVQDIIPTSKESLTAYAMNDKERKVSVSKRFTKDVRATSVTDLRKSFEKLAPVQTSPIIPNTTVNKSNSSSAIKTNCMQEHQVSNAEVVPNKQETELPDVNNLDYDKSTYKDAEVIVLRPEIPGGSVGITLAGGADYETKEITVHKIREDSLAHRNGRLQKGDTVISINGKSVQGLTHKQLVALLKEPLPEVTLAICRQKESGTSSDTVSPRRNSSINSAASVIETEKVQSSSTKQKTVVSLMKDASGLGLSLEGGQDSPLGNMPLLIKKIFKGGAAGKCGNLQVGDELLSVNEVDVSSMSRFEAWSVLKKLPEGITISLTVKR